ncbi:MAG: helix-turn-helix domain-containing protein [Rhodospirillaceae bacterium]|nr:helix-turn-helix domain-containing protein [Rhodospirillaceae bacterium]
MFRRKLQDSPQRYYLKIRLQAARNLLFCSDVPIQNVALSCGFSGAEVFSRSLSVLNIKRTRRIYVTLGLQLHNKTPKRRVKAKLRNDRAPASGPNETWAMDFVHDQLAMGKKIRILKVVDIFSKFSPVVDPRFPAEGVGRDVRPGRRGRLSPQKLKDGGSTGGHFLCVAKGGKETFGAFCSNGRSWRSRTA